MIAKFRKYAVVIAYMVYSNADVLSLRTNVIKLVFLNLENLIKILTFAFETFYPFLKDILKHFNKTD